MGHEIYIQDLGLSIPYLWDVQYALDPDLERREFIESLGRKIVGIPRELEQDRELFHEPA